VAGALLSAGCVDCAKAAGAKIDAVAKIALAATEVNIFAVIMNLPFISTADPKPARRLFQADHLRAGSLRKMTSDTIGSEKMTQNESGISAISMNRKGKIGVGGARQAPLDGGGMIIPATVGG
jgi:hypothetical protein